MGMLLRFCYDAVDKNSRKEKNEGKAERKNEANAQGGKTQIGKTKRRRRKWMGKKTDEYERADDE